MATKAPTSSRRDRERLHRQIDSVSNELPSWAARSVRWLATPSSRWVRIPAALLLIAGGVVGFLPVLGFWMVPLGVLLLALDIPFLRRPTARLLAWLQLRWRRWKDRRRSR